MRLRVHHFRSLMCIACLLISSILVAGEKTIIIEDFEAGLAKQWEPKDFKGETTYEVVRDMDGHVLRATGNASATGLIYEYSYDPQEYPIISWRWKVENIIEKGDASTKEGDDYSARVYVIFPHWFKPMTKSINYIWANKLEKGSYVHNRYYSRAIMIAVQSGPEHVGEWMTERRDVYEDYMMVFGKEPPEVGAIAIMTDTDNTEERAVAYYDDIRIEKP